MTFMAAVRGEVRPRARVCDGGGGEGRVGLFAYIEGVDGQGFRVLIFRTNLARQQIVSVRFEFALKRLDKFQGLNFFLIISLMTYYSDEIDDPSNFERFVGSYN